MDWNRIEGNWKQAKGKIKEQWGKLTDDDLDQIAKASATSWKARSRSVMASKRTVSDATSMTGPVARLGSA